MNDLDESLIHLRTRWLCRPWVKTLPDGSAGSKSRATPAQDSKELTDGTVLGCGVIDEFHGGEVAG